MNDLNVIDQQNERAKTQALIEHLKRDGYVVVVERQAGIQDVKQVYAYRDMASAKQNIQELVGTGKDSRNFEIV